MYLKFQAATVVKVSNHHNLLAAWAAFDAHARLFVSEFEVEEPLTASQLAGLPRELRGKVS